jgi:hypothetical protein
MQCRHLSTQLNQRSFICSVLRLPDQRFKVHPALRDVGTQPMLFNALARPQVRSKYTSSIDGEDGTILHMGKSMHRCQKDRGTYHVFRSGSGGTEGRQKATRYSDTEYMSIACFPAD